MGKWISLGHQRWTGRFLAITWLRRFVQPPPSSHRRPHTSLRPFLHWAAQEGFIFSSFLCGGSLMSAWSMESGSSPLSPAGSDKQEVVTTRSPWLLGGCHDKHRSWGFVWANIL